MDAEEEEEALVAELASTEVEVTWGASEELDEVIPASVAVLVVTDSEEEIVVCVSLAEVLSASEEVLVASLSIVELLVGSESPEELVVLAPGSIVLEAPALEASVLVASVPTALDVLSIVVGLASAVELELGAPVSDEEIVLLWLVTTEETIDGDDELETTALGDRELETVACKEELLLLKV